MKATPPEGEEEENTRKKRRRRRERGSDEEKTPPPQTKKTKTKHLRYKRPPIDANFIHASNITPRRASDGAQLLGHVRPQVAASAKLSTAAAND